MTFLHKLFRALLLTPLLWFAWTVFYEDLGAEPAKFLVHRAGEISFWFLHSNLFIGAVMSFIKPMPNWMRLLNLQRRWIGVIGFCFVLLHFAFYLILESLDLQAVMQIFTKTYLLLGFSAFLVLMVLAITSNNYSVRKLGGKKWKQLHRIVFVSMIFVAIHVMLIEKTNLLYYGAISGSLILLQSIRLIVYLNNRKSGV